MPVDPVQSTLKIDCTEIVPCTTPNLYSTLSANLQYLVSDLIPPCTEISFRYFFASKPLQKNAPGFNLNLQMICLSSSSVLVFVSPVAMSEHTPPIILSITCVEVGFFVAKFSTVCFNLFRGCSLFALLWRLASSYRAFSAVQIVSDATNVISEIT